MTYEFRSYNKTKESNPTIQRFDDIKKVKFDKYYATVTLIKNDGYVAGVIKIDTEHYLVRIK